MITEMELGHRIRDLRKKKGLSQLSFAEDITFKNIFSL